MKMENNESTFDNMLDFISKKTMDGYIVTRTIEGLISTSKDEFISQDADGILYDLNRDEATTLTLAKNGVIENRWVNDLAVAKTIRALKEKLDKYEQEYGKEN